MKGCIKCGGKRFWFDRTMSPPCFSMHNVCEDCGATQPCTVSNCLYSENNSHIIKHKYFGITHCVPEFLDGLWRKFMCKRGIHAFDEVESSHRPYHYLVCDACNLVVNIDSIDTEFQITGGDK